MIPWSSRPRNVPPARVRVAAEVDVSAAAVRDVCVELGRAEVGVPEHLLDAAEVGAALEQVCRERVPQQVRVDAFRLEARALGETPQDEERACARERAALRVEEQFGPVALVEVRAAVRQVTPQRLDGMAADGHHALFAALAGAAYEALLEIDASSVEPDGLAHPEAGAVEQLDEGAIPHGAWGRARGRLDQPLRLATG